MWCAVVTELGAAGGEEQGCEHAEPYLKAQDHGACDRDSDRDRANNFSRAPSAAPAPAAVQYRQGVQSVTHPSAKETAHLSSRNPTLELA